MQSIKQVLKLDADSPIGALMIARSISCYPDAEMRRSSSGRGFHFRVPSVVTGTKQNIRLRRIHHDCFGRVRADKVRMRLSLSTNVLFCVKNGRRAGEWQPLDMRDILKEMKLVCI